MSEFFILFSVLLILSHGEVARRRITVNSAVFSLEATTDQLQRSWPKEEQPWSVTIFLVHFTFFLPLSVSLSELVRTFCLPRYSLISKARSCHGAVFFFILLMPKVHWQLHQQFNICHNNPVCTMQNTTFFWALTNARFSDFQTFSWESFSIWIMKALPYRFQLC